MTLSKEEIHRLFIEYPTGNLPKGKFCVVCGKYNARYTACSTILTQDNKLLLILRGHEPEKGKWALPGGYLDWDETVEECAKRELGEETGYIAGKMELVGIYSDPLRDSDGRQNVEITFSCKPQGRKVGYDKKEVKEIKWFCLDALPDKLAFDHRKIINDFNSRKKDIQG